MSSSASPAGYSVFRDPNASEMNVSGVSWPAVLGGAFVAASLFLALVALGSGFGLSAVSPWSDAGVSASAVAWLAILWLVLTQIIAGAFGGYLTGRLRTKWVELHTDEVFFRDTANGFLSWAVGFVVSAAFLGTAAASMAGHSASSTARGSTQDAADPIAYFADALYRSDHPNVDASDNALRVQSGRILTRILADTTGAQADRGYLARLVAARTGANSSEAEGRVDEVVRQAKQAADTARKSIARSLLWLFVSFLAGAFSASYAATLGGKQRDRVSVGPCS